MFSLSDINGNAIEAKVTEFGLAISAAAWIIKNVACDLIDNYYELRSRRLRAAKQLQKDEN